MDKITSGKAEKNNLKLQFRVFDYFALIGNTTKGSKNVELSVNFMYEIPKIYILQFFSF